MQVQAWKNNTAVTQSNGKASKYRRGVREPRTTLGSTACRSSSMTVWEPVSIVRTCFAGRKLMSVTWLI